MISSKEPKRVQRKRTKGWKMPKHAIYVGRPTPMGNPFRANPGTGYTAAEAVADFGAWIEQGFHFSQHHGAPPSMAEIRALRGFDLVCWCALDQPCHADVLMEIANR